MKKIFGNKKRLVILASVVAVIGIAVAIVCFVFLRPGGSQDEDIYKPKLEEFRQVIADPEAPHVLYDGLQSVRDAALEFGDEALDKIGYVLNDVNNDGQEELFIGAFDQEAASAVDNEIYAAFTNEGGVLKPIFEKQKRNTFALTDTGTVYFYGTDDENYHILAEYQLTEAGELVCKDYYFTYPKDGGKSFGYFHNTTGTWNAEGSEELQMTAEEFEAKRKALAERTVPLEAVKFSEVG